MNLCQEKILRNNFEKLLELPLTKKNVLAGVRELKIGIRYEEDGVILKDKWMRNGEKTSACSHYSNFLLCHNDTPHALFNK